MGNLNKTDQVIANFDTPKAIYNSSEDKTIKYWRVDSLMKN